MLRKKVTEPVYVKISRIITGLVFIFSSIVKGIDPLGTDYRIVDYLEAYGWYFLVDFSFVLAIVLISAEFLIGIALLFKLKGRLAALGVLIMMAIFTPVTYFDAMNNMVPDCGCFGDAVKLTNWETFYKNIVLMILALIIFFNRKKSDIRMHGGVQIILLALILAAFDWFIYYNYAHLPVVDFRDWKVGNDMKSAGKETVVNYLVYKNKSTGEVKEYVSPNYPWNDSVWISEWDFVTQRIDDSQLVLKHGLLIEDEAGNNVTEDLIENPGYQLILSVYDISTVDEEGMLAAAELNKELFDSDVSLVMVTSSTTDELIDYIAKYKMDYEIYYGDDIELKAMIRSNPGMILLKDGIVLNKWHYNDIPNIKEVRELTDK